MPKRYRVFYYQGDEIPLLTQVPGAKAWFVDEGFHIQGKYESILIRSGSVLSVELYTRGTSMSVIRMKYRDESGKPATLHLAVIRFMIGAVFAIVNFFGTRDLLERLTSLISPSRRLGIPD